MGQFKHKYRRGGVVVGVLLLVLIFMLTTIPKTYAQDGFSLQVTPSPLVDSVKPGTSKTLKLNIRNTSTQTELLKIEPRSFTTDEKTSKITLDDQPPKEISDWLIFSQPRFQIKAGEWFSQEITVSPPKNAGFSYAFALVISRFSEPKQQETASLKGSVAVFTLINIDRPDAKRSVELVSFTSQKRLYEYLPTTFTITLKNSGNTIVQPYGNVYIGRSGGSDPIEVVPVNIAKSYMLPDRQREFTTFWENGFPAFVPVKTDNGSVIESQLKWDFSETQNFRIGRYTAKLVAVYNDGQRDVPIEAEVTFWVMPWKIILLGVLVLIVLLIGIITIIRSSAKMTKRKKKHVSDTVPKTKA